MLDRSGLVEKNNVHNLNKCVLIVPSDLVSCLRGSALRKNHEIPKIILEANKVAAAAIRHLREIQI